MNLQFKLSRDTSNRRESLLDSEELGNSLSFWMRMEIISVSAFDTCGAFCLCLVLHSSRHGSISPICGIFLFPMYVTKMTGIVTMSRHCRPDSSLVS